MRLGWRDFSSDSEIEEESPQLTYFVCLSFFQLCLQVQTEPFPLCFISALFKYIGSQVTDLSIINSFPITVYSLKNYTTLTFCSSCHKLFEESECKPAQGHNGLESAPKFDHRVSLSSHPSSPKNVWSRAA